MEKYIPWINGTSDYFKYLIRSGFGLNVLDIPVERADKLRCATYPIILAQDLSETKFSREFRRNQLLEAIRLIRGKLSANRDTNIVMTTIDPIELHWEERFRQEGVNQIVSIYYSNKIWADLRLAINQNINPEFRTHDYMDFIGKAKREL
jgi:hypothetical protein